MKEPISNVGFLCSEHASKPGGFTDKSLDFFVGKFAKLLFVIPESKDKRRLNFERMWVEVLRVEGDELIGRLDNDPMYVTEYEFNDLLAFKIQEIAEVYEQEKKNGS